MANYGYGEYVPAAVKKARLEKKLERMKKKNADLAPIQVSGRKLATTWWGIAWNTNLERYADYENRIGRGKAYLRSGAVLDLRIDSGKIHALVQGSRAKPYQVEIVIGALRPEAWARVSKACRGNIQSMKDLIEGRFPQALSELFTEKGTGLFPSPREIAFGCSCPDYAGMCKHVAAVLYGVGVRLDEDPTLFFKLRQVDVSELITETLIQATDALLGKSAAKSKRVLVDDDLGDLFGVDIQGDGAAEPIAAPDQPAAPVQASAAPVPAAPVQASTAPVLAAPPAKKRGRPRKTQPAESVVPAKPSTPVQASVAPVPVAPPAKKRGRPRKVIS